MKNNFFDSLTNTLILSGVLSLISLFSLSSQEDHLLEKEVLTSSFHSDEDNFKTPQERLQSSEEIDRLSLIPLFSNNGQENNNPSNPSSPTTLPNVLPNNKIDRNESASAANSSSTEELQQKNNPKSSLINFNNLAIIEYIRFISRISNKNFVFDEADLQFNVTIISEELTSIENIMAALIQVLRIHDLILIEQGNNLIIHKNPKVNNVSKVIGNAVNYRKVEAEIVTQVFRLNTLEPEKAAAIIRPLVSSSALVEFIKETNHLIVTDIFSNIQQISQLLRSIDAPTSGLVIGQYVTKLSPVDVLLPLVQKIMAPISLDQPLSFIPYDQSRSIFIVSTPFLVEQSMSILQYLDQENGMTRIIELNQGNSFLLPNGELNSSNQFPDLNDSSFPVEPGWEYGPGNSEGKGVFTQNRQFQDQVFQQTLRNAELNQLKNGGPNGLSSAQNSARNAANALLPEKLLRKVETNEEYVPLPINKTKFYIHKLQYRKGDLVQTQLQQIAQSLSNTKGNEELLAVIASIQWLQDTKSLVLTGTPDYIERVRSLIEQIDLPLRQVYIEMLILSASVDDSLNYSVNWGSEFGGGNQAGIQGFSSGSSPLQAALATTGVNTLGQSVPTTGAYGNVLIPDPTALAPSSTFSLGVLGQKIVHKGLGLQFDSIGALVRALHTRNESRVIMSPRIITEDNVPAYVFVGVNAPFQTQSVATQSVSSTASLLITNNFDYRDVGTSLQVTPHLINSNIVVLDIVQEVSSIAAVTTVSGQANLNVGPTTNKNTTKTTVHIPNNYFLIISGLMEDDTTRTRTQVPCLGGVPLIGSLFSDKSTEDHKRNLMIFIHTRIIDTDEEIQNLTRHQQDVWMFKEELPKMWIQETDQALDFLNVRRTSKTDEADDISCSQFRH